jgi:hypothetical protein
MFSLTELQGQSGLLHKTGTIELNTDYHTNRKPLWLVMLKLLGVVAMVAVGAAIAVPTLLEFQFPLWQAVLITAGGMVVYSGIAFFLRPEANTDNMGWGGGLMNDPFQSSDNMNRLLWRLHCGLGPGRFTAETALDLCALLGLARGFEKRDQERVAELAAVAAPTRTVGAFDATQPIPPLDPNRFAQSSANFVAGQIQLDTQRFLSNNSTPISGAAPAAKT